MATATPPAVVAAGNPSAVVAATSPVGIAIPIQIPTTTEANTTSTLNIINGASPPLATTATGDGTAVAAPTNSAATAAPNKLALAAEANALRLLHVVNRLAAYLKGGFLFNRNDVFNLCFTLARGIDFAVTRNDVPAIANDLPTLVKQVYKLRNEAFFQSAVMVLMISIKNACRKGWFQVADYGELLNMANELSSNFCTGSVTSQESSILSVISKIMPRFYPQLELGTLLVSFEAKIGYEILVADFDIPRNVSPQEKIRLLIAQADNIETSSCIISPPHVNFLINGKGVERRTNVSLDTGPQFPTDITKMLKYGTNLIQAIGYFTGNYIITVAFMSNITPSSSPVLQDYKQPVVAALVPDSELIEGPSRISLNCPISFRRIKTPVKGHLCKHHQCFDYDNFMSMNSRKPSWRCPDCNQPVSFLDLRIDQNMVKILTEAGEDVADVIISADGSWKISEHNRDADKLCNGTLTSQQGDTMVCEPNRFSSGSSNVVDLTMEDCQGDALMSPRDMEYLIVSQKQSGKNTYENQDVKPFQDLSTSKIVSAPPPVTCTYKTTQAVPGQVVDDFWSMIRSTSTSSRALDIARPQAQTVGASETFLHNALLDPVVTDAVSPVLNREAVGVSEPTSTLHNVSQVGHGQLSDNLQLQQSRFGNVITNDTDRQPIPRNITRTPVAVQALPALTQMPSYHHRPRTTALNSSSTPFSHQSATSPEVIPDEASAVNTATERQQVSRISDLVSPAVAFHSMIQNQDHQSHQQIPNPASQQVASLPAQNPVNVRARPEQLMASSHSAHPQMGIQLPRQQHPNLRAHQITSPIARTVSTASQFSRYSSMPVQCGSQNAVCVTGGSLTRQASLIAPRTTPSTQAHLVGEQLRSMGSDVFVDLSSEQNWRPTGRMRGSLTGVAYCAALGHYNPPPNPSVPSSSRPPASNSSSPSAVTPEQLTRLVSNLRNGLRNNGDSGGPP